MRDKWNLVRTFVAWAVVGLFLAPIVWLLLTSLRPDKDLFSTSLSITGLTFKQYIIAFKTYGISRYLSNSILLSLSVVILNLIFGVPAAYALSRISIPGKSAFIIFLMFMRIVPIVAIIIPLFLLMSRVHLTNTLISLVIAHTAFKFPMTIWLCMISFLGVPVEIEEAAELDGASHFKVFLVIVVPMILPGLSVAAIVAFIYTWNDLLVALILINTRSSQTLTVGLSYFLSEYGIAWGPMSAAGVVALIPVIVFALFAGEALVKGLASGAVKM
ncbi:Trehalose transport system permease protein SugB [subsurface metagenome]